MIDSSFSLSGDLSHGQSIAAISLGAISLALLAWELLHHRFRTVAVTLSGLVATALLVLAVLRPVKVTAKSLTIGPRLVVLADRSYSMALPGETGSRVVALRQAVRAIGDTQKEARVSFFGFGQGAALPFDALAEDQEPSLDHSDLSTALFSISNSAEERPSALILVSDGRFDQPTEARVAESVRQSMGSLKVPIHTVSTSSRVPSDASIRAVRAAGAAVAHQPLNLSVDVGCEGLACGDLPILVQEIVESGAPLRLANGVVHLSEGKGTVDFSITLDRAGPRVVQVGITAPSGDEIPENDARYLSFDVGRDRVRILHISGRPSLDGRALRQWLKADASLDIVAFFILRTATDDVNASPDDLSLIKFPVDELFTEHLPSFDAVVLQDFNAIPYGLAPYLSNLARYVDKGGGLVMVGGENAFTAGGYASSPIEPILPVALIPLSENGSTDLTPFVPSCTAAGRESPVLEGLRGLLADDLPLMIGTNLVGDPHPGTVVLWEHPSLKTASGKPMPILSLGEHGNGRTLALTLDDTHKLAFGEAATRHAGRAYGYLWDGLLGWLMKDPRYEPARVDLLEACRVGRRARLRIRTVPGLDGSVELTIVPLGNQGPALKVPLEKKANERNIEVNLPLLSAGAYAAQIRVGTGPSTRRHFACEKGGDEWADSRPDPERMALIAKATGGQAVDFRDAGKIPLTKAMSIASERHVSPVVPPWVWTTAAALALGLHWIARRKSGLA